MLVVKIILISSVCAFAVSGKLLMDDITVEGNPDYLDIKADIDKSGSEPVVNVDISIKQDLAELKVKVSLSAKIAGEFMEIYPAQAFNPCKGDIEDEFVKYALDQIQKFGNLTIACPLRAGHYVVENFKMDDDDRMKSFSLGHFRVDVKVAVAVDEGKEDTDAMTLKFAFHGE